MSDRTDNRGTGSSAGAKPGNRNALPQWTEGLRRLYDEVVDEDLPDSFRDLLARLDDTE